MDSLLNWLKCNVLLCGFLIIAASACTDNSTTPAFDTALQARKDDTLIRKYVYEQMKDPNAKKDTNGVYYVLDFDTASAAYRADTGKFAFVRYTGYLLDSTEFDSNVNNSRALIFQIGLPAASRSIIKGMDAGILKFGKGSRGRIYIPSGLAYGNTAQSKIPANSVLVFSIELVNLE